MIGRNYAQHSERWAQDAGNAPLSWTGSEPPPPIPTPTLLAVPPPVEEDEVEGYAYDADGNRTAVTVAKGDTLSVMQYNLINLPSKYANAQGDTVR